MPLPRALLVSLRDHDDPMAAHERECFARAAALPVDHVAMRHVTESPVDPSDLARADAVFFGGSGAYSVLDDAPWMPDAMDALLRTIDARTPAWASCFGFQAVARTLGATVVHDEALTEMGGVQLEHTPEGAADPLVGDLPDRFWVQEGHHDHVLSLPDGVTRLARGAAPVEQLFRVDGTPFYASQFHPELDVHAVIFRFRFYRDHYFDDPTEADALLEGLRDCDETPEVSSMLARLVRGAAG